MPKDVLVLSGGLDSTVAATQAVYANPDNPDYLALSFDYGQRHRKELEAAETVARTLGIPHEVVDVQGLLTGSALLHEADVPDGHYADESMAITVVHARNMLFASIAVSRAGEGGSVTVGVHGGDHFIYPDCRPSFWTPYSEAVRAAYGVEIVAPFIHLTKADIAAQGSALGAPLALTWSCYKGGELHCGECGTCVERREAFDLAQVTDPTGYKSL